MTELDIRLGINGLRLENADVIEKEIDDTISTLSDVLTVDCASKDAYKLYKDARKELKDIRSQIKTAVSEKVKEMQNDVVEVKDKLLSKLDDLYDKLDAGVKAYEEENCVGAYKAAQTKAAKQIVKDEEEKLFSLSIVCPSILVKEQIEQYAISLGATIL